MKKFTLPAAASLAALSLVLTSCQTTMGPGGVAIPESGAAQGGLIGGAIGGLGAILTGNDSTEDIIKGVAIGAAAGAATGAVVENNQKYKPQNYPQYGGDGGYTQQYPQTQGDRYGTVDDYRNQSGYNTTQPQYQQPQYQQQYQVATRTTQRGIVTSPHSPYRKIDVSGFRSGEAVLDPVANKPFLVP